MDQRIVRHSPHLSYLSLTHLKSIDPSDEVLKEVFREYAKEKGGSGLTAKEQLGRLKKELNLLIS